LPYSDVGQSHEQPENSYEYNTARHYTTVYDIDKISKWASTSIDER